MLSLSFSVPTCADQADSVEDSSYTAESMGSVDSDTWDRFAGRSAGEIVLGVYMETFSGPNEQS